ncbi:MAG: hypothetical protein ACREP9_19190 [Candidatus Dormibacteraceae bacterium]
MGESRRYRAWITLGPAGLSFAAVLALLRALKRLHPELAGISCGSSGEGQVCSASCSADTPEQAAKAIEAAFQEAITETSNATGVKLIRLQLERTW